MAQNRLKRDFWAVGPRARFGVIFAALNSARPVIAFTMTA